MTGRQKFSEMVRTAHRQMGGRASAKEVATHVETMLTDDEYRAITRKGFNEACASVLRQVDPDTGRPDSPCVGGQYVQDSLLTSDELRALTVQHWRSGDAEHARARAYARRHLDVYGIAIDPATGEVLEAVAS